MDKTEKAISVLKGTGKIYDQSGEHSGAGTAQSSACAEYARHSLFLAIASIIGSGIVLQNANGPQALLVGGLIGIGSSTLIALFCAASVVITLISLTRPYITRR